MGLVLNNQTLYVPSCKRRTVLKCDVRRLAFGNIVRVVTSNGQIHFFEKQRGHIANEQQDVFNLFQCHTVVYKKGREYQASNCGIKKLINPVLAVGRSVLFFHYDGFREACYKQAANDQKRLQILGDSFGCILNPIKELSILVPRK